MTITPAGEARDQRRLDLLFGNSRETERLEAFDQTWVVRRGPLRGRSVVPRLALIENDILAVDADSGLPGLQVVLDHRGGEVRTVVRGQTERDVKRSPFDVPVELAPAHVEEPALLRYGDNGFHWFTAQRWSCAFSLVDGPVIPYGNEREDLLTVLTGVA